MARGYYVNGEVLVRVKGATNSIIGAVAKELGICSDSVVITPNYRHMDIAVDAWGGNQGPPPDVQWMLADAIITMTLVHYDPDVLALCLRQSMAGGSEGALVRAGSRYGNDVAGTAANNLFIQLHLSSPIGTNSDPWYFPTTLLTGPPMVLPLGVQRSLTQVRFRAIPYQADPYGGGTGASSVVLWSHANMS